MRSKRILSGATLVLALTGCVEKDSNHFFTDGGGGSSGPVSASDSSITVVPSSLVADGVAEAFVTVQVRDSHGNPVPDQAVTVAVTGSSNVLSQPPAVTDANGFATARLSSTRAETKTITVTVNPGVDDVVLLQVPSVDFVGDAASISAADTSVQVVPATGVPAEGVSSATVTVVVRDAFGNPVAGQAVELAASGSGHTITQPAAPTDAAGVATGTIVSVVDEVKTITATVDPGLQPMIAQQQPTVEFVALPANTFFVRTTGVDPPDCSGGTSPATAWRTLSKAAACVEPGDTVYVGAGTYAESVVLTTPGTELYPIRFVADTTGAQTGDGGAVVVDCSAAAAAFDLDGTSHVVLDGFTIRGSASSTLPAGGVSVRGADGVVVRNCVIHDNALGIALDGAPGAVLESNSISTNFDTLGYGVLVDDSDDVVVRNNLIYANLRQGVLVTGGSTNVLIESNTLYRNGTAQIDVDAAANDVLVRDNVICDAVAGIVRATGSTVTSKYNCVFGHVWNWIDVVPGPGDFVSDPLFADADGADDVLGGAGGLDDLFHLDATTPSPGLDAGELVAASVLMSDGSNLSQLTTGLDGVNDGTFPDGELVNVGYHYPTGVSGVPPPPPLAIDDTRIVYGTGTAADARLRAFDRVAATWSAPTAAPPAESTIRWTVNCVSPSGSQEELFAIHADDGYRAELDLIRWSGTSWSVDWTTTSLRSAHADKRLFDVEYEAASGDAIAVWADATATPRYRTFQGGVWSADQPLPLNDGTGPLPDVNSGAVLWMELEPRPGTDEIALAFADENNDLVALTWDGTQWDAASAALLEAALRASSTTSDLDNRPFDLAYESVSGDVVVAWVRAATNGFWWSQRTGGSWSAAAQVATAPSTIPHLVDLAPEMGTDRIAIAVLDLGEGAEQLGLATWDGTAWLNAGTYDVQIHNVNDTAIGDAPGGVGWVGTSGRAVCVFADDLTGRLDWASWTAAGGWVVQADVIVASMGFAESIALATPAGVNELMVAILDSTGDLYAFKYDGTTWTIGNLGSPLEANVSSIASAPFSVGVRVQ